MKATPLGLPGLLLIEPDVFRDERGVFLESWNRERYEAAGIPGAFVQDNLSVSSAGVLRGLHYQNPSAQGKLVMATSGAVYDVAVDLRTDSPTFRRWEAVELSGANLRQLWIPPGFAHGFLVLEDQTRFSYKCTAPYVREHEHTLRWDDPELGIEWPTRTPILSARDAAAPLLRESGGWLFGG